jgi:uncharacterized membrane protein (UPF0127 family)
MVGFLVALALLAVGCASESTQSTTAPPSTVPGQLAGFSLDVVDVDDRPWLVAIADTGALRAQGLMGVSDLGSLDGMLFVFTDDSTASFHMKDTLIPLDIAFFDVDGLLVSMVEMVPCVEAPCASYAANGPYRYALEAPAGALRDLPAGAVLDPGTR